MNVQLRRFWSWWQNNDGPLLCARDRPEVLAAGCQRRASHGHVNRGQGREQTHLELVLADVALHEVQLHDDVQLRGAPAREADAVCGQRTPLSVSQLACAPRT